MLLMEIKRFFYSNKLYFTIGIAILIVGMNAFLTQIYNISNGEIALFNSFTQFSFLILPVIVATSVGEDFQRGTYYFLRQLGYSSNSYIIAKVLTYLGIAVLYSLLYMIFTFGNNGVATLILFFNITIIVLLGLFFSLIIKNSIMAIFSMYIVMFVGDLLNLVPIFKGWVLLPDKNSISTAFIMKTIGEKWDNIIIFDKDIPTFLTLCIVYLIIIVLLTGLIIVFFKWKVINYEKSNTI